MGSSFVIHNLVCFFIIKAEGFSGADLAALLREAGLDVLRRLKNNEAVERRGCTFFFFGGGGGYEVYAYVCMRTSGICACLSYWSQLSIDWASTGYGCQSLQTLCVVY